MQELKALLVQEAIADLRAELLVRAWQREQLLEALVNGLASSSVPLTLDLSLPARLTEAVARLQGKPALTLTSAPTTEEPVETEVAPESLTTSEPPQTESLPAPAEPEAEQAPLESTEVDELVEEALVTKIRELRQQEPPAAWTAIASELGLSEYALRKLREQHGL
jgi:hypothetical protein